MKLEIFVHENTDYLIQIGQNQIDNDEIVVAAVETDIWFHGADDSSCHVILKNTIKLRDIPRQVIKRCAYLCKINSQLRKQKKCNIMYTKIENVVCTDIPGQVRVETYKLLSI
jgi:predicted ribosome quality control (RQC) complex YloA/Tae2 family protein